MKWRVANALVQLRKQINEKYPTRSKESDGSIGDAAHASRSSDHNPWIRDGEFGVVSALDITNDPGKGVDCARLAEVLRAAADRRIKYIIWNKRIWNPDVAQRWRTYNGSNPHDKHMHISVKSAKLYYDDVKPWDIDLKKSELVS